MENKLKYISGFSLLELMVVFAVIAVATLFAYPSFEKWNKKKSLEDTVENIYRKLSLARTEALTRSTTTRVNISKDGADHTITSYFLADPTISCDLGLPWIQIETTTVELDSQYESSGTGIGNICFYRDGTSTGGSIDFVHDSSPQTHGSANIDIIMATGFVDLIKNY